MKKWMLWLLIAATALSLCACGGSDDETGDEIKDFSNQLDDAINDFNNLGGNVQTNQTTEDADAEKPLPQIDVNDVRGTSIVLTINENCPVTDSFNGPEVASGLRVSHLGYAESSMTNYDIFRVENPSEHKIMVELHFYQLIDGQRAQSYTGLSALINPQKTVLVPTTGFSNFAERGAYEVICSVREVTDETDDVTGMYEYTTTYRELDNGKRAYINATNLSAEQDLQVYFTVLLLNGDEIVYVEKNVHITHKNGASDLDAGKSGSASISPDADFDACVIVSDVWFSN